MISQLARSSARTGSAASSQLLRSSCQAGQRRLAGGGVHYNEPTGRLFGETPPPPGQKRVKEDWENIWYYGMFGGMALFGLGYIYKPDTSINSWAIPEARKNLDASGKPWRYQPSPNSGMTQAEQERQAKQ